MDYLLSTLGTLSLSSSGLSRPKPLLLLAYLCWEGETSRQRLAEVFFGDTRDPRDGLSAALQLIRKAAPDIVKATPEQVAVSVTCDAVVVRDALRRGDMEAAAAAYTGAFGVTAVPLGPVLEAWVFDVREQLAAGARGALLDLAEQAARTGTFSDVQRVAERALALDGHSVDAWLPDDVQRLTWLLAASDSAWLSRLGDALPRSQPSPEAARSRYRTTLLGRRREVELLTRLPAGARLWVQAPRGYGKSALLTAVPGITITPALLDEPDRLIQATVPLIVDDWATLSAVEQRVVLALQEEEPGRILVVAARSAPDVPVTHHVRLEPLPADALSEDTFRISGGHPMLASCMMQGRPIAPLVASWLMELTPQARDILLALSTLDIPDLAVIRDALRVTPDVIASALVELQEAGLCTARAQVIPRGAILEVLDTDVLHLGHLHLCLARALPVTRAWSAYERCRPWWEPQDEERAQEAALRRSERLMHAGQVRQAQQLLQAAPPTAAVRLALAAALERDGQFLEARTLAMTLPASPERDALLAAAVWRLGDVEAARAAAQGALAGPPAARCQALQVLGNIASAQLQPQVAVAHLQAAADLAHMVGDGARYAELLNDLAVARARAGTAPHEAFRDVLRQAEGDDVVYARAQINLGRVLAEHGDLDAALTALDAAIRVAQSSGATDNLARAWLNAGVIHHVAGRVDAAAAAYDHALSAARSAGDLLVLATALGNRAELHGSLPGLREAIRLLEQSGHQDVAAGFQVTLRDLESAGTDPVP